ncbi:MAG: patatin-like phospholipase family protein [Trueperaceae bacterium]|nr:patatin-like phospholipase family protein [Trueperaceae bacterium]
MDIGLVLGGGGARGYAHIGALRALLEHDCQPVAMSGCSMGGLVGAFFAAGYSPDDMQKLIEDTPKVSLLEVGARGGLIGGGGIERFLSKHLPETFEELSLPLAVTAVDVQKGELVVLRSGPLVPALRATSALPGILTPVKHQGRYLIDGGLLNNLPVDVISSMTLEPIVAVDIAAPPNRKLDFGDDEGGMSWPDKLRNVLSSDVSELGEQVQNAFSGATPDLFARSLTIELFMKSFDIPQTILTETRLSLHPPALLIRPELDSQFGVEDFERLDEAVEAGYRGATERLKEFLSSSDGEKKYKQTAIDKDHSA